MVSRCKYQSSSEVGAYATLTDTYCLLPTTTTKSWTETFDVLTDFNNTTLVMSNIAGTPIVGRLTVGNKNGLLVPLTTTDSELAQIEQSLPDGVVVERIEEKFSALGNVISCNDHIALIHPELDQETVEIIKDVLQVDVFPTLIANESLVGSYSVFTNRGGIVTPKATVEEIEELSGQLGINIEAATVNRGSGLVNAGILVNNSRLFCGWETTALEIANLTRIFKIDDNTMKTEENGTVDDVDILALIDLYLSKNLYYYIVQTYPFLFSLNSYFIFEKINDKNLY
ncbi:translation initiation factor eIF-6, putative family protein [Trichomonas vaginalis G3]|uniref:Eukaryotic translation initiation factor 6 n=1 Tax=Trichomonas vaginalis (strain ATCC PRA-98 / G3) TaxID=412133 RepID=A2ET54_TRIV3|nr:translation initiation factor eIF-6 family protein [Trichomonas vaginalis G3]EAY04170.1 translation initiation factor eIF-6, putative family protein [Trichomonas vaginalis G3]KAI5514838.1 mature ribosome assembly [Trichomonas vaginalis G3]|eukprot:XP_001316393.1 translation initiation factor eIF-6 family protein [Trichomonas vaginalis G3]